VLGAAGAPGSLAATLAAPGLERLTGPECLLWIASGNRREY
jgi:hypothetical protein